MQKKLLKNKSFRFLLLLTSISVIFVFLFTFNQGEEIIYQDVNEVISIPVGSTVLKGDDVIDEGKVNKFPVILRFNDLISDYENYNFFDAYISTITGAVSIPASSLSNGSLENGGVISDLEGPGYLDIKNNKIIIVEPSNFVYGFKTPYTRIIKTKKGIKVEENGTITKEVSFNDINENNIKSNFLTNKEIKEWAEDPDNSEGSYLTIDYSLSNFSDSRSNVKPEHIEKFFGKDTIEYMKVYPSNSPVMAYTKEYEEVEISSSVSSLGSYPAYGDAIRAGNARSFTLAWNGTIIPNGTSSSGKQNQEFGVSIDPKAPGGAASHGVCPPARSLRGAITQVGIPLPQGMSWSHEAILFGYSAATGIKIKNTLDNPIRISMWTTGSGTGLTIYTKIYKLVPKKS